MKPYLTPRQFTWIAAVAFVVWAIAVIVIQSRHDKNAVALTPTEPGKVNALESDLARCRTISLDDLGLLESCRQIWAENRKHFFLSTKSPHQIEEPAPDASVGAVKNWDGTPPYADDQPRAH
jgi:conjugative transfer region protein TrbK